MVVREIDVEFSGERKCCLRDLGENVLEIKFQGESEGYFERESLGERGRGN